MEQIKKDGRIKEGNNTGDFSGHKCIAVNTNKVIISMLDGYEFTNMTH